MCRFERLLAIVAICAGAFAFVAAPGIIADFAPLITPALAQIPAQQNTVVDMTPVTNALIQASAAVLSVIVPAILWRYWGVLSKRFGLADLEIEAKHRAAIDEGIAKAIGLVVGKVGKLAEPVSKIDVRSPVVASVANTVISNFPDTVKALGLDEKRVAEMVLSRLGIMAIQQTTGVTPPGLPNPPPPAAPAA